MKLKNSTELGKLLGGIEKSDKHSFEAICTYIDSLHDELMDYQLIIDSIYHNVKDEIRKHTL